MSDDSSVLDVRIHRRVEPVFRDPEAADVYETIEARRFSGDHMVHAAGLELPHYPDWMADALCGQVGGEEWFPEKGESTKAAKDTCARCPVISECLEYALARNERFGVWGGKSERERRALRERGAA